MSKEILFEEQQRFYKCLDLQDKVFFKVRLVNDGNNIMRQGKEKCSIPPNIQRHNENLSLFTGWKGGVWYEKGVANPGTFYKNMHSASQENKRNRYKSI